MNKVLFAACWAACTVTALVGAVACMITEGCSILCDALDAEMARLREDARIR
jgi:hypothetical protein